MRDARRPCSSSGLLSAACSDPAPIPSRLVCKGSGTCTGGGPSGYRSSILQHGVTTTFSGRPAALLPGDHAQDGFPFAHLARCPTSVHHAQVGSNSEYRDFRCAIAHLGSGPEPVIGPRFARTRWDHPGMTHGLRHPRCQGHFPEAAARRRADHAHHPLHRGYSVWCVCAARCAEPCRTRCGHGSTK
jgi:hypothetical protein